MRQTRKQMYARLQACIGEIEELGKKWDCYARVSVTVPDDRFDKTQPLGLVTEVQVELTPHYDMFRSTLVNKLPKGK